MGGVSQTVYRALSLAHDAHKDQTDKAGEPYILHPIRVALSLHGTSDMIAAALLHDTLEDTDLPRERIAFECGHRVADWVEILTRDKSSETYDDYIRRVSMVEETSLIKLADLADNLDPLRIQDAERATGRRLDGLVERYERARWHINAQNGWHF